MRIYAIHEAALNFSSSLSCDDLVAHGLDYFSSIFYEMHIYFGSCVYRQTIVDMDKQSFDGHGLKSTPDLTLNGINTIARVVSVHDGDTLTAVIHIFGGFYRFHVRLDGIDTCEMTSHSIPIKRLAIQARDRLIDLITCLGASTQLRCKHDIDCFLDKSTYMVRIECGKFDKYGRLLGRIFPVVADVAGSSSSIESFNEILVLEKLAYRYNGGTKLSEETELLQLTQHLPKTDMSD